MPLEKQTAAPLANQQVTAYRRCEMLKMGLLRPKISIFSGRASPDPYNSPAFAQPPETNRLATTLNIIDVFICVCLCVSVCNLDQQLRQSQHRLNNRNRLS